MQSYTEAELKLVTKASNKLITNENLLLHMKPPDAKDHVSGTAKEPMEVMSGGGQMAGK